MDYDMKRFMERAKEMFNYTLMAYKGEKNYRHPEDVDPKDFVVCKPDTWNKRMIEKKRKKEAR